MAHSLDLGKKIVYIFLELASPERCRLAWGGA